MLMGMRLPDELDRSIIQEGSATGRGTGECRHQGLKDTRAQGHIPKISRGRPGSQGFRES
jgi:hypothetical protein